MKPIIYFYLLVCGFLSLIFKYIHLHLVSRLRTSGAVTLLPLCIVRRGQDKAYLYLSPSSQTPTVYALPETPIVITAQRKRWNWGKVLPCFNLSFFEHSNKLSDLINSQEFFEQLNKYYISIKKTVLLQAWSGPEGSRKLRFPHLMTTAEDGGKVVSLTHRPPLPPGNTPGTHFC